VADSDGEGPAAGEEEEEEEYSWVDEEALAAEGLIDEGVLVEEEGGVVGGEQVPEGTGADDVGEA